MDILTFENRFPISDIIKLERAGISLGVVVCDASVSATALDGKTYYISDDETVEGIWRKIEAYKNGENLFEKEWTLKPEPPEGVLI